MANTNTVILTKSLYTIIFLILFWDVYIKYFQQNEGNFSVVSAFGIEYAISASDQIRTFIESMPRLMRPSGIVAISFYAAGNVDSLWKRNGFQPVRGYSGPLYSDLYVFNHSKISKKA